MGLYVDFKEDNEGLCMRREQWMNEDNMKSDPGRMALCSKYEDCADCVLKAGGRVELLEQQRDVFWQQNKTPRLNRFCACC